MLYRLLCSLCGLIVLAGSAPRASAQVFTDPAPPPIQKLAAVAPPEAQKQPGLKFHAATRPTGRKVYIELKTGNEM